MLKSTTLCLSIFLIFSACSQSASNKNSFANMKDSLSTTSKITSTNFEGNYVSQNYGRRSEGFDWVAVIINKKTDSTYHFSIRSRTDKKKPTCTYDIDATLHTADSLAFKEGGIIYYVVLNENELNISAKDWDDNLALNYYCSGGGSFAGDYTKINEALDPKQIDNRNFYKNFTANKVSYEVTTIGTGSIQQLTVQPSGLKEDNDKFTMEIDGQVSKAEIADLNGDGFPELLIYTTSAGSGSYGNIIAFSPNNGKSLSTVPFFSIAENPKANSGYMGHDEFTIVNNNLVQTFPIYKKENNNSNPTGGTRQIIYKLKDGEASRIFVVDKITEIPAKK